MYSNQYKLPNSTPFEFAMVLLHVGCLITVVALGFKLKSLTTYLDDDGPPVNLNVQGYIIGDTNISTIAFAGIALVAYIFYYIQGIINSSRVSEGCCCTPKGLGIFMNILAFLTSIAVMIWLLDCYKIATGFQGCEVYQGNEEFCETYIKEPAVVSSTIVGLLVGSFIFSCVNKPLIYSSWVSSSTNSSSVTTIHKPSMLQQQQPLLGQPQPQPTVQNMQGNLQNV